MVYYTAFFILVYVFSQVDEPFADKDLQWTSAFYIGIAMLLLMGLRDQTVAGDTVTYVGYFISRPIEWHGLSYLFTDTREPLFYLLEYFCQQLTSSYTVYLFATSIMVVVGFSSLLKNYSADMFLSVLLFCGVGSMYFCMAGLRQAIAMGFTMLAFRYANERKPLPFLALCAVAFGFHNSAIVFIITYVLIKFKANWKMAIPVIAAVFLGVTRNPEVMIIANYFTTKEYLMAEQGLNYTMFFIQLVFVVFCFFFRSQTLRYEADINEDNESENDDESENKRDSFFESLLMMSFVGLCFQALTPIMGEFFRVSSYFSVYLCLAVPMVLESFDNEDGAIYKRIIIVGLLAYIYIFGPVLGYVTCFG